MANGRCPAWRLTTTVLLLGVLTGCATASDSTPPGGRSGPVAWEIVDLQERVSPDGQRLRWDFTVVLRETAGVAVQFDRAELRSQGGRQLATAAFRTSPLRARVAPRGELRLHYVETLGWLGPAVQFGGTAGLEDFTAFRRFYGTDDRGGAVFVEARILLGPGRGKRIPTPPLATSSLPPPRVLQPGDQRHVAGEWQGYYQDGAGFHIPTEVRIKEDGSFEATEGEPAWNRFRGSVDIRDGALVLSIQTETATLRLHEGVGRRILDGSWGSQEAAGRVSYPLRLEARTPA